ncbi:hypothetical protein Zmor_019167 [Zophobas morio]|uniref:Uncharacterized protein n=1 Tax=Zophobas morio TaxID=2755281 RepID=A0AA38I166_9CUCU|nr:hypothetical protein Zmor_019167 [Zophobas morio]
MIDELRDKINLLNNQLNLKTDSYFEEKPALSANNVKSTAKKYGNKKNVPDVNIKKSESKQNLSKNSLSEFGRPAEKKQDLEENSVDEDTQNDVKEEWTEVVSKKKPNKRFKNVVIIGKQENQGEVVLRTVPKYQQLHVYRLVPETTTDDLQEFLKPNFPEVLCDQLSAKYPEQYLSFKVSLYSNHIAEAMKAEVWPKGACVRKFFQIRLKDSLMKW